MSTYFIRKAAPSEDALTGMLADLMRWGAAEALTRAILRRARSWGPHGRCEPPGISFAGWTEARVRAWPSWPGAGEPDLVVDLWHQGQTVGQVVIEAKFGAAKSGGAADGGEGLELKDQLAKYAAYVGDGGPSRRVVLYLTHHPVPPAIDLRESGDALGRLGLGDPLRPSLAWLSWKDIQIELSRLAADSPERALSLAANDAAQVLRANGFFHFTGAWAACASDVRALPAPPPPRWSRSSSAAEGPSRQFGGVWSPAGVPAPASRRPTRIFVRRFGYRWSANDNPPLWEMTWKLRR